MQVSGLGTTIGACPALNDFDIEPKLPGRRWTPTRNAESVGSCVTFKPRSFADAAVLPKTPQVPVV